MDMHKMKTKYCYETFSSVFKNIRRFLKHCVVRARVGDPDPNLQDCLRIQSDQQISNTVLF
jgi:hypothetical protein